MKHILRITAFLLAIPASLFAGDTPASSIPEIVVPPSLLSNSSHSGTVLLGTDVVVSSLAGPEAKVCIDVNPANRDNLVVAGEYQVGYETKTNTFYSTDGGVTWARVSLGDAQDGITGTDRFDPSVAFDADGNVYVAYVVTHFDAGPIRRETLVVCKSTNGGQSYTQFRQVVTNNSHPFGDTYLEPGNSTWRLATGRDPVNASQQNVYVAGTQYIREEANEDDNRVERRIVFSRSTDGGNAWSVPVTVADDAIAEYDAGQAADPAVGPNGEVYVAWHDLDQTGLLVDRLLVDRSTDGGVTWGTDHLISTVDFDGVIHIPPQADLGTRPQGVLDVDRSGGPNNGRLYFTYMNGTSPNTNIFCRTSDDGGTTWSAPVQVNDDATTNSQFLPWCDLDDSSGNLSVIFYDARDDANNKKVHVYHALSTDGGASFGANTRVTDNPSDNSVDNASRYVGNFSEYIGVAATSCAAYAVWSDNSGNAADSDFHFDFIPLDNSAPSIVCPSPITVECTTPGGTPADNPAIVAFLSGASATDTCDDALIITHNAPPFFPDGPTTVTFSTTDDAGHTATCQSTVTVEDTTPPVITVVLDRDVLWPPNHKLVEVCAEVTVTDICDPDATWVLTGIVSDEPDNDKGDGNTVDDIQNEATGTADECYDLRSERQGKADGRKYTLYYQASDNAGNTADDTVCVRVPHDHSSSAFAANGFEPDGAALEQSADRFAVVILSLGNVEAISIEMKDIYLGNTRGVTRPLESRTVDANNDRRVDAVYYFDAGAVSDLSAAAVEVISRDDPVGALARNAGDGPLGIHFVNYDGEDYLIGNIFALGAPVTLRPIRALDDPLVTFQDRGGSPRATGLSSIHPNPFNPQTTVDFALASSVRVRIAIYDVKGSLVRRLVDGAMPAGEHHATWNGLDDAGHPASSGIYFVRMVAARYDQTRKIVMLK